MQYTVMPPSAKRKREHEPEHYALQQGPYAFDFTSGINGAACQRPARPPSDLPESAHPAWKQYSEQLRYVLNRAMAQPTTNGGAIRSCPAQRMPTHGTIHTNQRQPSTSANEPEIPTPPLSETQCRAPARVKRVVSFLDEATVRRLLATTFPRSAEAYDMVTQAYKDARIQTKENECLAQARVLTSDHHLEETRLDLNERYLGSKGSVEYENAFKASENIVARVSEIAKAANGVVSVQTRYNALKTLCDIGITVLSSYGFCLGRKVVKNFAQDHYLADGMLKIVTAVTNTEMPALREKAVAR